MNSFNADIGGGDLEQTLKLALGVGPLGRALREHPELAGNVVDAFRDVLSNYLTSNGVRMPGAVWIVLAQGLAEDWRRLDDVAMAGLALFPIKRQLAAAQSNGP